ncbi:uncharacterized protein K02A2.6-like, partial [Ruditapes philippinarum]|uniref:uncharacterized protein K02A2.6-like n=1 Tax=Ruditapes philippinarum TaxID=129788 RepID=UPI00295A87EA
LDWIKNEIARGKLHNAPPIIYDLSIKLCNIPRGDRLDKINKCKKSVGVTCFKCGKPNHFAKLCKSKSVNFLETDNFDGYSSEEIYAISGKNAATLQIVLENKKVDVLIDSGSSVNIIDEHLFGKLKHKHTRLLPTSSKVYPYGIKTPIKLIGMAYLNIRVNNETHSVEFQILKGTGKPLLGHETALKLGLLHIGPLPPGKIHSLEPAQIKLGQKQTTESILSEYDDRFQGLGRIKDFKLKLYIDESVQPVAQNVRRIPFKMKKLVEKKIDELEKLDIIEKVEGPTPWVSNLVPIPKQNNDVRLCVDMRMANKAILRERFPMPNIEEVLMQMNGSVIFSKLDLKQSFHQIELDEKSRYITTFVCHKGLYQYKVLNFGINMAPETHQRIIQQLLQDIPNCQNIADDIIIYADSVEKHNKALVHVLQRLCEKNLTLNRDKCEFC